MNNGYDKNGFDKNGFDKDGFDKNGFDKDGYTVYGYTRQGYNRQGYNINGIHQETRTTMSPVETTIFNIFNEKKENLRAEKEKESPRAEKEKESPRAEKEKEIHNDKLKREKEIYKMEQMALSKANQARMDYEKSISRQKAFSQYTKVFLDTNIFMGVGKEYDDLFKFISDNNQTIYVVIDVERELEKLTKKADDRTTKRAARTGIKRLTELTLDNLINYVGYNAKEKKIKKYYADNVFINIFKRSNEHMLLVGEDRELIRKVKQARQSTNRPNLCEVLTIGRVSKLIN